EQFLTGSQRSAAHHPRLLATVLAARLPPHRPHMAEGWHELIGTIRETADRLIRRQGGHLAEGGGPELLARFDGPSLSIRCAIEIVREARELGLAASCGVHVGEIQIHRDGFDGEPVRIATGMAARAKS